MQAYELFRQSLAMFEEIGAPLGEINDYLHIGRLHTLMGNYDLAQEWFDRYRHAIEAAGRPAREYFMGMAPLALLAHDTGDAVQALAYAEQGWQLAQQLDGRASQARALVVLGLVRASLERLDQATGAFEQALDFYTELGQAHATVEPLAGLARVALAQGKPAQAQTHVDVILEIFQSRPVAEVNEPFGIYLICYRILAANNDPRAATVIETAYALLHQYAERISDEAWRRSFWENVAVHRELQAAYLASRNIHRGM